MVCKRKVWHSILETLISGVPFRDDSDSEIELEQLESDTDSEVAEWIVIDDRDTDTTYINRRRR